MGLFSRAKSVEPSNQPVNSTTGTGNDEASGDAAAAPRRGAQEVAPQQLAADQQSASVDQQSAGEAQLIVVDVMPKPEILDPQGKAVSSGLRRLGYDGLSVRQGKRFEISVDGPITPDRLEQVRQAAAQLLANTVIESFTIRVEDVK